MWQISLSCILLVYSLYAQELTHLRAGHGEHCNKTTRCDTSAYLTCSATTSICECPKADTMYYDPVIKSCLVLVGERCKYKLMESTKDSNILMRQDRISLEDELDCVQNAFCNSSGFCMCAGDYVELSNGTCITKRNLGETCSSDGECRQDQFLMCVNGHCSCNETTGSYNILIRQCVGKAGYPCLGSSAGCVYNAECVDSSSSYLGFTKRRMRQSVRLCGCNPGFLMDESGFCRVGFNGKCSGSKICANNFHCSNGHCRCPYENLQLALPRSQTCQSLVGGPCNETVVRNVLHSVNSSTNFKRQSFVCVENADCALSSNGSIYQCQCKDGYVVNSDGTCDLSYGSSCNSSPYSFVDTDTSEVTDRTSFHTKCGEPLSCIDSVCQCESLFYEYDNDNGTCLGKVGARCDLRENEKNMQSKVVKTGCILGAECAPSRDVRAPYGKCLCATGLSVTRNRTCM